MYFDGVVPTLRYALPRERALQESMHQAHYRRNMTEEIERDLFLAGNRHTLSRTHGSRRRH